MSFKQNLNRVISTLVKSNVGWSILRPIAVVGSIAMNYRRKFENPEKGEIDYDNLFKHLNVLNGPFKGMRYPSFDSVGSTICPKLIGSYESELHESVDLFRSRNYTEIVDIGCAEGYYAIGLGLMFPSAKVYAYDIDEKARVLCKEMAEINNIKDRVIISSECRNTDLGNFKFTGRGLIISDCEGYEKFLFNKDNIKNLANCDFLIETHDFVDIEISTYLFDLFPLSHNVKRVSSIDDIQKARTYNFPETQSFDLNSKKILFSEGRPHIMEWLVGFSLQQI